jgi:cobalt-zinc-cadmium efflux system protein
VSGVHHLHIWPLSTTETAMTAHLVLPVANTDAAFIPGIAEKLRHDFKIGHATIQIDPVHDHVEECAPSDPAAVEHKAHDHSGYPHPH